MSSKRRKPLTTEDLDAWNRVAKSVDRRFKDHMETQKPAAKPPVSLSQPDASTAKRSLAPVSPPKARIIEPRTKYEPPWRAEIGQPPVEPIHSYAQGVDRKTARRLTRGDVDPCARIDLHGMTESRAHQALVSFVIREQQRGSRWVLVITGKGGGAPGAVDFDPHRAGSAGRGVLKRMTPFWLRQAPLAGLVTNIYEASKKHGGAGALYVSLRKR